MPFFDFTTTTSIPSSTTTASSSTLAGTGSTLRFLIPVTATGEIGSLQSGGVVFTFSTTALTGQAVVEIPGTLTSTLTPTGSGGSTLTPTVLDAGIFNFLDNNDGNDSFLLTLRNSFLGPNVSFSGTTGSPVVLGLSAFWQNGSFQVRFTNSNSGGTVTQTVTANDAQVSATGVFTGIVFASNSLGADAISIDTFSVKTVNCFAKGTLIDTPDGAIAVEKLAPGDIITTGNGTTSVKWIGKQPIDTRLMHPVRVNPICITAGALGYGLPKRDFLLSADHAIAIDGYLINAGALVNGTTIYQLDRMPKGGFSYYHVDTGTHELLLAEGVESETFIDYAGRDSFENGAEATATISEMDMPRISSARLVPDHIRAALAPAIAAE